MDRPPPPPWFEPKQHWDDREPPSQGDELPLLETEAEVAEPSQEERTLIETYGVDALAYYAPFHFYRRGWGIYVRDYGIALLASRFLGKSRLAPSDNWALRCAYWFLFEHEYFHFQTELAASRYELTHW